MAPLNLFMNYFVIKFARKQAEMNLQAWRALMVNQLKQHAVVGCFEGLMEARKSKAVSVIL